MTIGRRLVLKGAAGLALGATGFAGYAFAVEPHFRLEVVSYAPTLPGWPEHLPLSLAFLSDIHAGGPHMTLARLDEIVARTNALKPDLILLGGDFQAAMRSFGFPPYEARQWAAPLGRLTAPLGVFAVLGNHDWWHGAMPSLPSDRGESVRRALREVGIQVLENRSVALTHLGRRFWLSGLGDQIALLRRGKIVGGVDDLPATLAAITDDAPALLLAHEPDIIYDPATARFALTLSGHTHGGQVRLFGYPMAANSPRELSYGLVTIAGRTVLVTGGLGTSILPMRFGVPPEIVMVRLGARPSA